jgi:hypothetical protein
MQTHRVMNRRIKKTQKLIKNALDSMPDLPFIPRRSSPSVASYVLGAIGIAVAGAVAAVMIFSPRTRYRAMLSAKDVYGKVQHKVEDLGITGKNGISKGTAADFQSSSGL